MKPKLITEDHLFSFYHYVQNQTSLYQVSYLGYPWYQVAIETLGNKLFAQTARVNNQTTTQACKDIRFADFQKKLPLLNQKFDFAFIVGAKMRRRDPNQVENYLFQDIFTALRARNKKFIIFENSSGGDIYDLKYLQSEFADVTVPYEFLWPGLQQPLLPAINKAQTDYLKLVDDTFRHVIMPEKFAELGQLLRDSYHQSAWAIKQLLTMRGFFSKMGIQAFFGGMGSHYTAGLNNSFAVVEVGHGFSSKEDSLHLGHGPALQDYYRKHLNLERFYKLELSLAPTVTALDSLTLPENVFNYGAPELRAYRPSDRHLQKLKDKYQLQGKRVVLIATNETISFNLLEELLQTMLATIPNVKIILRPNPSYDNHQRYEHYVGKNDVAVLLDENILDLILVSDVVITPPSSVPTQASAFTRNIIVYLSESKLDRVDKLVKRFPFAIVIPLYDISQIISETVACLNRPLEKKQYMEKVDYEQELDRLFEKIEMTTPTRHQMKHPSVPLTQLKTDVRLAVCTPYLGAISETFISRQIQHLAPGQTVVLAGEIVDDSWLDAPKLKLPYPMGRVRYSPQVEQTVHAFFEKNKINRILCQYGTHGGGIIELNANTWRLPLFVHFHGFDASQMLQQPEMLDYYRWMGQHVTGIITVSQAMSQRLIEVGLPAEKIICSPYGVEIPSEFAQPNRQPCRLISVTRLYPKKGPLLLLKAFAKARQLATEIALDIIGEGPLLPAVEEFIRDNNLGQAVRLHGAQPNSTVKSMLRQSGVYVQHSIKDLATGDAEGLPVSILEASAVGLPIIATLHEGIPEAVDHGETGFLVEEFDVESMAQQIVALAHNPDLRANMGAAARQKIQAEFSLALQVDRLRLAMDLAEPLVSSDQADALRNAIAPISLPVHKAGQVTKPTPRPVINLGDVAVIIPTFNRAQLVKRAIQSVQAQSYAVKEIIVVDDASTDSTESIVSQLARSDARIVYLRHSHNRGAQAARNTGLHHVTAQWVTFLDSDDEFLSTKVEKQLKLAFSSNLAAVHCECYVQEGDCAHRKLFHTRPYTGNILVDVLAHPGPTFPGLFAQKTCFETIGDLDEAVPSYQEWDTFIRLAKQYSFGYIAEPLFVYYKHTGQTISKDMKRDADGWAYIVNKYAADIRHIAGLPALINHYQILIRKYTQVGAVRQVEFYHHQLAQLSAQNSQASLAETAPDLTLVDQLHQYTVMPQTEANSSSAKTEQNYLNLLARHPNHKETLLKLGNFYLETRRYQQALDRYMQVIKVDANAVEAWGGVAQIAELVGDQATLTKAQTIIAYSKGQTSKLSPAPQSKAPLTSTAGCVKGYLSAAEVVSHAQKHGLSVCDYLEMIWHQEGDTEKVVAHMKRLGALSQPAPVVVEVGAGSGRYLEKVIVASSPKVYEVYEPAQDWATWLAQTYPITAHPADGSTLSFTGTSSADLVHAHGVFTYIPFLTSYRYWLEIIRVLKAGGYAVFDIIDEACMDEINVNNWLDSAQDYPVFIPQNYGIKFFAAHRFSLVGDFFTRYGPGKSHYLVLKKQGP